MNHNAFVKSTSFFNRKLVLTLPNLCNNVGLNVTRIRLLVHARALWRPSKEDVDRLSRGLRAKQRGTGSRSVPHRLNLEERRNFEQAIQNGYVSLPSNLGIRRERKGSPLYNTYRNFCDSQAIPAIFFVKRGNRRSMDEIWIDFSTLRGQFPRGSNSINDLLTVTYEAVGAKGIIEMERGNENDYSVPEEGSEFIPTWRLPEVWLKYQFEDRTHAKSMSKKMASLFAQPPVKHERKLKSKPKKSARRAFETGGDDGEQL